MSLDIPWQSGSPRPFCTIEQGSAFQRGSGPQENEMLRSLTFIFQLGYGFKLEPQGSACNVAPHQCSVGGNANRDDREAKDSGWLVVEKKSMVHEQTSSQVLSVSIEQKQLKVKEKH